MTEHLIGYVGRPTRDHRLITELTFPDGVVLIWDESCRAVGEATGFAIDDLGAVTCTTDYPLSDGQRFALDLSPSRPVDLPLSFAYQRTEIYAMAGALIGLTVIPLGDWNWSL